jgi:ribonuclease HI
MGKSQKYYAVARGIKPGIYTAWFGPGGAEELIRGFAGALYKKFASLSEAERWIENPRSAAAASGKTTSLASPVSDLSPEKTVVYTDGGWEIQDREDMASSLLRVKHGSSSPRASA